MSEDRRGSKGARKRRRLSKSTPAKKGWPLSSWAPLRPRRFSLLQTRLCGGQTGMKKRSLHGEETSDRVGLGV